MSTNIFVSFDHDDSLQVNGFKALRQNPNHPLDFQDHSLNDPVVDKVGTPLPYPPTDPRSKPVREEIISKFGRASKLVVLVGPKTSTSEWVTWEINTFYEMKHTLSGQNTWKLIRGMFLKGHDAAKPPAALMDGRSTKILAWNPEELDRWIDVDPDK
jgi:hypothetical protein